MTFWPRSSQPSPYHHHHYHHITITTITTVHIDRGVKLLKDAPTEESGIPNLLYVDFYDSELQGVRSVGGGLKNSSCLNPFAECYHSFSATLLNPMNSLKLNLDPDEKLNQDKWQRYNTQYLSDLSCNVYFGAAKVPVMWKTVMCSEVQQVHKVQLYKRRQGQIKEECKNNGAPILRGKQLEDTFENTQWRKAKQVTLKSSGKNYGVWLCTGGTKHHRT